MISYTKGDLLSSKAQALVNTVNTVGVMGKGIALHFKELFPYNFTVYAEACKKGELAPGKMLVVKKYRGKYAKCLETYVRDRIQGREDSLEHDWLFITHTPVTQECYDAVMKAVRDNNYFGNVYETNAGCTVSCHCGPGTLGVLFIRK